MSDGTERETSICPKCGLPKELCVCETLAKEQQKVVIKVTKKRYGKLTTEITGIDTKQIDIKDLTRKLKQKLACGGSAKGDTILLQGEHKEDVKKELIKYGFTESSIEMK